MNNQINKIIRERRSVFPIQFNGEIINNSIIKEIIFNANTAPTHKITQPWLFKIFSSQSKKKLADEILRLKFGNEISKNEREKLMKKFNLTSHIICICLNRSDEDFIPEWEEIAAVSMSVQNMWLTCTANNLGCYWSSPKIISKIGTFLNLRENQKCLGLFYIGKHNELAKRSLNKKDVNEKVEWL
jgi:nitroreductase|tara:strand:+ start:24428 stop:24985 length:558 start_codon:yes stop_codon:yes gene_type:complete